MPIAWTDAVRPLEYTLEIYDGLSWADESENLLSASGMQSSVPMWRLLGGNQPQQPWNASFVLRNVSNRYSPTNSSSPLYSVSSASNWYGVQIRFTLTLDGDSQRVFTGYIDSSGTSERNGTITLNCVDNAHPLLESRTSTTLYQDQRVDEVLTTLADTGGVATGAGRDFDQGLFDIPFSWLDEESIWAEMNLLAQSEGGTVYFDREGVLTFENAQTWVTNSKRTTSQATFTVSNFKELVQPLEWKNIYNRVLVEYQPRELSSTVRLYENRDSIVLRPSETRTVIMKLSRPAASIETLTNDVHFVIVNAGGNDVSGDVTISTTEYAQRVVVSLENTGNELVYVNRFDIYGVPLVGAPTMDISLDAADSDIGDPTSAAVKMLRITGNPFVQTIDQAEFLCQILRDRVKTARAIYQVNGKGNPNLQPLDRVTVVEADSGVNNTGYIQSISWSFSGWAYNASYEIIEDTNWLGYDDYFLIETSAFDDGHRAFY